MRAGRIDNLAEDTDVLPERSGGWPPVRGSRQIDEFIGTAHEGDAEFLRETIEIGAASPRQ